MRLRYKFIHFVLEDEPWADKPIYRCKENKNGCDLGYVGFFDVWGMYCFYPEDLCIFSTDCMIDIIDFIKQLKAG